MAASRLAFTIRKFSTNSINLAIKRHEIDKRNLFPSMAQKNSIGKNDLVQSIARTEDGSMIVAWHPDVEFPYEYSRPIPEQKIIDSGSLLKETALKTAAEAFKNKHPEVSRQELMNLTHTTKHRWFPRARDKRAKKTPMDRKYL